MNDALSLITLIKDASLLVQLVMLLLVVMSLISWFVILEKGREVAQHYHILWLVEDAIWSGGDMRSLFLSLTHTSEPAMAEDAPPEQQVDITYNGSLLGLERIFVAGFQELQQQQRRADTGSANPEAILENATRNMRIAVAREEDRLTSKLSFLATVGGVSPYIGLFGTVWGIMNAFRSLANASQVSLASVAPGISEALIATAMGLLAAIPAVIAYNRLTDRVDRLLSHYEAFIDSFTVILERRLGPAPGQGT